MSSISFLIPDFNYKTIFHSHICLGKLSIELLNTRRHGTRRTQGQHHCSHSHHVLPWWKGNAGDGFACLQGATDPRLWCSPTTARKSWAHQRCARLPCLALPTNSQSFQGAVSKQFLQSKSCRWTDLFDLKVLLYIDNLQGKNALTKSYYYHCYYYFHKVPDFGEEKLEELQCLFTTHSYDTFI